MYLDTIPQGEIAKKCGLDRQTVRNWLKTKKKGKIACVLMRNKIITINEYKDLKDGNIQFYNNLLFAVVFSSYNLTAEAIAALVGMTVKTLRGIAAGNGSDKSKTTLFYVVEKRLGIENAEELYNGTLTNQSD